MSDKNANLQVYQILKQFIIEYKNKNLDIKNIYFKRIVCLTEDFRGILERDISQRGIDQGGFRLITGTPVPVITYKE